MEAKAFEFNRGSPRTQKHDVGQVIFDHNCDFVPIIEENNSLAAETTKDRRNRKEKFVVFHVELTELFLVCRRNNICRIFNVLILRKSVFLDKASCCSSWKLWDFASFSHFFSEQKSTIHPAAAINLWSFKTRHVFWIIDFCHGDDGNQGYSALFNRIVKTKKEKEVIKNQINITSINFKKVRVWQCSGNQETQFGTTW